MSEVSELHICLLDEKFDWILCIINAYVRMAMNVNPLAIRIGVPQAKLVLLKFQPTLSSLVHAQTTRDLK